MDYSLGMNWLFRPKKEKRIKETDVFFVYPTVFGRPGKKKHHNMNPYNPLMRFLAWVLTIWRASFLAEDCNVFTPHYRQVGIETLEMKESEAKPRFELAYSDVRDAFLYYMEHLNEGRPFILAGHSQGSAMLLELLLREFSDDRYDKQFVAAYIIGFSITKEDLEKHPHLKLAEAENDTGVIISYNTSAEGVKLMRVVRKGSVCVNPLNWKQTNEYAPRQMNLGSVLFKIGRYTIEKKQFTGAYICIKQGVVMIDKEALHTLLNVRLPALNRIFMSRMTLHTLDIALFYRNLQRSVKKRIENFAQQSESK